MGLSMGLPKHGKQRKILQYGGKLSAHGATLLVCEEIKKYLMVEYLNEAVYNHL